MDNLTLARKGDKDAFLKLIQNVKTKLYKTGMAILKNDDDVCDALQETLINAYKKIDTLNNPEYFNTWMVRIMINNCYEIIRKNKKEALKTEKLQQNSNYFYDLYCEKADLEILLNKKEEDLRMVTVLFYYDDIQVKDISKILKIPEGTVKSRLSRARKKISEIYKLEDTES